MRITAMKMQWIVSRCLLAFVLITIGYALGRESGLRSAKRSTLGGLSPATNPDASATSKVVVTYFHATFRCVTCNTIEQLSKETVDTRFADSIKAGRLEWRTANYQDEEALASQYGIAAACVVVAVDQGGKAVAFDRLDKVWDLIKDPTAFSAYVGDAIQKRLNEGGGM